MLHLSTFFYKVLQRSMGDTIFLHFSIISTLFIFCRKCKMLIYKHFCVVETCRTCRTGETVFFRETFFFWALPFRSGYAGVSSFRQLRSLSIPNAFIGLSLLIGLSAARQTIIRYNCYILYALDFPGSRYLQSLAFPSLMRLFSHCKGKTRPLRTAALCKVMPSRFG